MWTRSIVAVIQLFLVVVTLLSLLIDRPVVELQATKLAFQSPENRCAQASEQVVNLPSVPVTLYNNGQIEFLPCSDGVLSLTLAGSVANQLGAHGIVSQRGANLWEGVVVDSTQIDVEVRAGYWVVVAFVNDASDGVGDRNLWLEQLSYVQH